MNFRAKRIFRYCIIICFLYLLSSVSAQAQLAYKTHTFSPLDIKATDFKVRVKSYGVIIGAQRGKYTFMEIGVERHWSKIKLIKPRILSIGANMEYNFGKNVLGYKVSVWYKVGKVNLTYGLNLCYLTDFDHDRVGLGPAIGFRLLGFHLVNGYNFTVGSSELKPNINILYLSLRYFIPLDKKIRFKKSK